ncbi:MAG: hypothetical protein RIR00_1208 [Pseudomonadota bacterium]|jgi:DNA-binding transcriptional LysR family regulator
MKISLDALQVLDAIDRHGTFAAAGTALHRVTSAISHSMRRLEDDLGVPLFEKSGRRTLLSAAGRTLLEDGRELLDSAAQLECRVRRVATGWEAELRLAVDGQIPPARLFPLVKAFYAVNPDTTLRLSTEVLGGCWDALVTRRADLVVGAPGDLPPGLGLVTRPLGHIEMLFAVAPQHPLASATAPIPGSEQRRHRGIVVADTSRQLVGRSVGLLQGQRTLTVPDLASKLAAQVAGLGVGYLPRHLAAAALARGELLEKELASAKPVMPLFLAWRQDHAGRALQWFVERLESDPSWAAGILCPLAPATA